MTLRNVHIETLAYGVPLDDLFEELSSLIQKAPYACVDSVYTRYKVAEVIIGDVSAATDNQYTKASRSLFPNKKLEAVKTLYQNFLKVAAHYDAFPADKLVSCTESASPPGHFPQTTGPENYASAVRQNRKASAVHNLNKFVPAKSTTKPATNNPRTNDRLFVRNP